MKLQYYSEDAASYPGSSPTEKRGENLEDLITCLVTYYACMVLIFELLPTQSVPLFVSVVSGTRAVIGVLDQWMSLRL